MKESKAKAAHTNLVTDTVIANLPSADLRAVLRSLLASDHSITNAFQEQVRNHLAKTNLGELPRLLNTTASSIETTPEFGLIHGRIRATFGCGLGFESLNLLVEVVKQVSDVLNDPSMPAFEDDGLVRTLAEIDGDIVQAVTVSGAEAGSGMNEGQKKILGNLKAALEENKLKAEARGGQFFFERALTATGGGTDAAESAEGEELVLDPTISQRRELLVLGNLNVPRVFTGLWQLSSPAWGTAPWTKISQQFRKSVEAGFTAFDMADHYGDAEVLFGRFRKSCRTRENIVCATKYCVFKPVDVTPQAIRDAVTQRVSRIQAPAVDLLQFHWQNYDDKQYIKALQLLQADERVSNLGLCNFDTVRVQEIAESGIKVISNQVQFSLIDSRPTFAMGETCLKYNIKLLTYGSLVYASPAGAIFESARLIVIKCGGFLAEKWLGKPEPDLFAPSLTPSSRKYLEMINAWGGWTLFQELLRTLDSIAEKHSVTVSNVATRWVLDFPYVGAVIVGARMGVSEHIMENAAVYGWSLDAEDRRSIEELLLRSRRKDMFRDMGDCGAEYRI